MAVLAQDIPGTAVKIYALTVFGISILLYLPIAIYGLAKFYRFRNHIIIKKRYPQITKIICLQLIAVIIAEGIRSACQAYYTQLQHTMYPPPSVHGMNNKQNPLQTSLLVSLHIQNVCTHSWRWWTFHPIIAFLSSTALWIVLKAYLNYYAIKYSHAMITSEWKHIINPQESQENWFIINRLRFGSYSYWRPFGFSLIVLSLVICYLIEIYEDQEVKNAFLNGFGLGTAAISTVIMMVIRIKTPKFNDIFHQRKELRRIIFGVSIAIMIKICTYNLHDFLMAKYPNLNQLDHVIYVSEAWLFSSLSVFVIYTLTIWVIHQNQQWLTVNPLEEIKSPVSTLSGNDLPTLDSCGSNNLELYAKAALSLDRNMAKQKTKISGDVMTVNDVLAMDGGFEALLFHFAQEFSTEIILCLLEITQFQQVVHRYYRQNYHRREYGTRDVLTTHYWLTASTASTASTSSIPRSSIVFGRVSKRESTSNNTASSSHSNLSNLANLSRSTPVGIHEHTQLNVAELEMVQSTTQSSMCSEETSTANNRGNGLRIEYEPELTKCEEFVQRARAIHDKYISVGSEFEVNLSWTTRCTVFAVLQKLMRNENEGNNNHDDDIMDEEDRIIEIYQLFIPVMDALHLLLRSTFNRFTASALFEQLIQGKTGKK